MRAAALLVALAVLGPRASAQPNAALSRTPASPIRIAQNAAEANEGRSLWDILPWAPRPKRELTQEEGSGALQSEQGSGDTGSGSGDVSPMTVGQLCSLCQDAINDNDAGPGPDWLSQASYINAYVMADCARAMIRACYQDDMNMPASVCEDEAYQIVDFYGWVSPGLNNFNFTQLIACVPRSAPPCSLPPPPPLLHDTR
jgi:hypothetical protein